jgi:ABC-type lipoprotein release transport system permease subunit
VTLPTSGLVVGERVAEILQLRRGDVVEVEILEARRGVRQVHVADVIKSYFGLAVFMDLDALDALVYGARLTGVHISYDAGRQDDLFSAIKSTRAEHQLFRHDLRGAGDHHRLRRGLQQRAHPALRECPRAGEPASAGLHAG